MRIYELISEQQSVGTVGSTTGMTQQIGQVQPVSQNTSASSTEKPKDPNQAKLAALLTQQGKTKPEDLQVASTALQKTMQNPNNPNLNDTEKAAIGGLMGSAIKDPSTINAIKAVAQQKPQQQSQTNQSTTAKPMGQSL